ncbi:ATP-binding protein [Streptomyces sp. NPDC059740]|uniref:ATP-binding protein n=1 Tax=Streptomyces sp. NPDC059740 TaxID=3346926 RepID=UPI003668312A
MTRRSATGRFPVGPTWAFNPWRGAKEVSGVTLVMAHEVPAASAMAVPHSPAGVGVARRRMREELRAAGVAEQVVDDAVLVLSELLSNACRHARPLPVLPAPERSGAAYGDRTEYVRASWSLDAQACLTVSVTDGGGPTRPLPATPSITAHGGRGLAIIRSLAKDWGVRSRGPEVTVWAVLPGEDAYAPGAASSAAHGLPADVQARLAAGLPPELAFADLDDIA